MFQTVIDIIVVHFVNLDGGVLGVNLALDEGLEDFWHPDVEADLAGGGDNLEAQMFLDTAGVAEFVGVAKNAVERGEKLLGGELFLVVRAGDFEHEEDGIDVEDGEFVDLPIITIGEEGEDADDGNPDDGHKDEVNNTS